MDSEIKTIESTSVKDKYYVINHPSGLRIYVYPKEAYKSAYAIFGTKYGSVYTRFKIDGGDEITVPDGIAHYLEHKMFECEEGDAFERYAATGANANAYTSFDKTCYLFSCTEKFEESLEILLDFVQRPYFTAETVAKEQGIIGQEIKMYDDSPEWRVMFNTLTGMYHTHPVRIDIAGTVESIAEITAEKLYECYNCFYNLNNMVLCVAGNVTVEQVLSVADRMLKPNEYHKVETMFDDEPYEVAQEYVEQTFPVSIPMFNLGFKVPVSGESTDTKKSALMEMLLFLIASPSSKLYGKLMDEGLINETFSYEVQEGPHYCAVMFGGESRNPKRAAQLIKETIRDFRENGIPTEEIELAKRAQYGETIAMFDNIEVIANALVDMDFTGREIFDAVDCIANAAPEQVQARLMETLDPDNCTLSVVKGDAPAQAF